MAARTRSRFDEPSARPASDAYTGLLALSLLAMIASCVILYLDFAQYGTQKAPAVNIQMPAAKPNVNQAAPATGRSTSPAREVVQAPATIIPVVATEPAPPEPAPVLPAATTPSLLPPANN